jgi:APA family basic amino acid/polyamine antiporter
MNKPSTAGTAARLQRRLGTFDAVVIGLGSMIGAGIFAALAPAARAAGSGLLLGLAVAAVVAYCNATSSARLAARYPASGGTYVYGRERLGEFWGYLAGWGFVVGKTASCAAMALTVGFYVWPGQAHVVAVAAVGALTAVNYAGVQKSAWLTRAIVAVVLVVLTAVVVAALTSGASDAGRLEIGSGATLGGVLQAAGLLFFAFAGYARIATPRHTDRVGHHPGGLCGGRGRGADRAGKRGARRGGRPAGGCGPRRWAAWPGTTGARRRGGRRDRLPARADPGGLAHDLGHGP